MRRLFDDPTDHITVHEAYDVPRPRPPSRPWLGVCMVASIDGSTVIEGNSRGLSSKTDQEVLLTLRDIADVLIVGAATVRIEGYRPPRKAGQRVGVVSRRGDVDLSTPLFTSGAGFLILPLDAPATTVDSIRAGTGEVDLAAALAQLDADFVQAEGGARLNGALSAADVIDELNLTISPQLSGGDGPRVTSGSPQISRQMRLAHVLEEDGYLFTRYLRARP
jgi:riboflavin biosynthesis pyrimidine reductase